MYTRIRVPAAALIALIAALTAACNAGHSASPAPRGTSSASARQTFDEGPVPSSVPRQYVALDSADFKRLSVRETVTGRVLATVSAPRGMVFTRVFGAGTGRVFVVDARQDPPTTMSGDNLFLLRLGPGSAPRPLVSLRSIGKTYQPVSVRAALSPDGAKIAIAYSGPYPPRKPLTVYSTVTGAVLRSWAMSSGLISSGDLMASGGLQDPGGTSMRWTADGRGLAYAFHSGSGVNRGIAGYDRYASIRMLDTTKPGSDLLANSKVLVGAGVGYIPGGGAGDGAGIQCLTGNGWSLSADGQAVTCAAEWIMPGTRSPGSPGTAGTAACPTTGKHVYVGFWRSYWLPGGGGGADTVYGPCLAGFRSDAQLYWASPDGRIVLGAMNNPGNALFGMFSSDRTFIPLAAPPARLDSLAW